VYLIPEMRLTILFCILVFALSFPLKGQILSESNLPIIIIATDNSAEIPDEPKIGASMVIISRSDGERNHITDLNNPALLNYNGRIGIETRGGSTQDSPKKQYGFTTLKPDNVTSSNVSLLGMPSENDWILNGMTFDTARIRDYLCYNLSRQLGNYASRTDYCEVIINGDYMGLYVLEEKIKAGKQRVDVKKIEKEDNTTPDITGGYITKSDKPDSDPVAWTMYSHNGWIVPYIHVLPKPDNATAQQTEYIKGVFTALEEAAKAGNESALNGYPSMIDVPSFIDFMIINELASNVDNYTYSTFFHKDRNGKLRAGPVWDFDLTFGNDLFSEGYSRGRTDIWYFDDGQLDGSTFWIDLFNDLKFRCYMSKRWNWLVGPGHPLNYQSIEAFIDGTVANITEAVERDKQRWNISGNYLQRITQLKTFIKARITWITANLGSFYSCSSTDSKQLVITKIMYHPETTPQYPDAGKFEFIEIRNSSSGIINLTGIQFAGTGLVYRFPYNTLLMSGSRVLLASDSSAFTAKYGFSPFGEFTRNLSDSGEYLVLTDDFGNVIDSVNYSSSAPWPNADGNGKFLSLSDPGLDNSLAVNWRAESNIFVSSDDIKADPEVKVFPNPVKDKLRVQSSSDINTIYLYDLKGSLLMSVYAGCDSYDLDMSAVPAGIYILKLSRTDGYVTRLIIRN
jgi:hypothetical protein